MAFGQNAVTTVAGFCQVLLEHATCIYFCIVYGCVGNTVVRVNICAIFKLSGSLRKKKSLTSGLEETQGRDFLFSKNRTFS